MEPPSLLPLPEQGPGGIQKRRLRTKINSLLSDIESKPDLKTAFLEILWKELKDDYEEMIEDLTKACKEAFKDRQIPGMIDGRAKSCHSIAESLERREGSRARKEGPYKKARDMLNDVHDLAGIRIVVDFPNDLKAASAFVAEVFCLEKPPNIFSESRQVGRSWKPWFGAYGCENHHVVAKFQDDDPLCYYNDVMFEVQVTSLPASLYNRIAHPLHYKKEAGDLSRGDEIVIDLTKGLALCYSLCLYYKKDKLAPHQIEVMRQADSISKEGEFLDKLAGIAPNIPELEGAAGHCKPIPRETLQIALESISAQTGTQTTDELWNSLVSSLSQEIREIRLSPIELPITGKARFDSDDVNESPKCQEGTQTALRSYIRNWVDGGQDETTLLWIHGPAGTGKSTVARTVVDDLTDTKQIAAGYFFRRGDVGRNHESYIFPTIASQLITTIPRYESALRKSLGTSQNSHICSMQLQNQFKMLVEGPLSEMDDDSMSFSHACTKVIVIDALDECSHLDRVSEIIRLLYRLKELKKLRVRLLVTSRGGGFVQKAMDGLKEPYRSLPPSTEFRNDTNSDIETILRTGFAKIRADVEIHHDWPADADFQEVVRRATFPSPLFIYAATLLRFLHDGTHRSDPKERLRDWINRLPQASSDNKLDEMYTTVFEILDQDTQTNQPGYLTDRDKKGLHKMLGAIVLVAEPLPAATLGDILEMEWGTVKRFLQLLHAVLKVPVDLKGRAPVEIVHLSFSEFILKQDVREKKWFHTDKTEMHNYLAGVCIKHLRRKLKKNICKIQSPGMSRLEIDSASIDANIPAEVQYASLYWSRHFLGGGSEALSSDSLGSFLNDHFLHWIESLSILGRLGNASFAIQELRAAIQPNISTARFLADAQRWILKHGQIIDEYPLQTYGSALVFSPTRSIVRQQFWNIRLAGLQGVRGIQDNWDALLQEIQLKLWELVNSIAVSPDGQTLASAGSYPLHWESPPFLQLWHTGTGACLGRFDIQCPAHALTWTEDGKNLISVSPHGEVYFHDRVRGISSPLSHFSPPEVEEYYLAAISPGGMVAVVETKRLGRGMYEPCDPSTVHIWDFNTGMRVRPLEIPQKPVRSMVFSPDNSLIAIAFVPGLRVHMWDGQSEVVLMETRTGSHFLRLKMTEFVHTLAFTPSRNRLFILGFRFLTIFTIQDKSHERRGIPDGLGMVSKMAIFPDGTTIATGGGLSYRLALWDVENFMSQQDQHNEDVEREYSARSQVLDLGNPMTIEHADFVTHVAISPDGRLLVTMSENSSCFNLWHLPGGTLSKCLGLKPGISVSGSSRKHLWSHLSSITFSTDGNVFVAVWDSSVVIWMLGRTEFEDSEGNLMSATVRSTEEFHSAPIRWDLAEAHNPEEDHWIPYPCGCASVFLGDGKMIAVASYDVVEVSPWGLGGNIGSSFEIRAPNLQPIQGVVYSPDSKFLAVAYSTVVEIWALGADPMYDVEVHETVQAMVFSPDGAMLAFASVHAIYIWHWMSRSDDDRLRRLFHDESTVLGSTLCFAPNGSILASRSMCRIDLWDIATGTRQSINISQQMGSLLFSKDGKLVGLRSKGGPTSWYRVPRVLASDHQTTWSLSYDERWIQRDGEGLFRIPAEYRPRQVAYGTNCLILVVRGKLWSFDFA